MSVKKFIKKILRVIAGFFQKLPKHSKKVLHAVVEVTEAIKEFDTKNPHIADFITAIIPGGVDDLIKDRIRKALPDIMIKLRLVDESLGLTDPAAIVKKGAELLQSMNPNSDERKAFLRDIATLLARAAEDWKIDWQDAVYSVQWYKDEYFSSKNK